MSSAPYTRQNYPKFRGKTHDDADDFIDLFETLAVTNKEGQDAYKLRVFPGLLRKTAQSWLSHAQKSRPADVDTWDKLKKEFLKRFRTLDYKHIVLKKLSALKRKKKETLADYKERYQELLDRIPQKAGNTQPYSDEQAVMWFLDGLPEGMEMYCRRMGSNTLDEAFKSAETYEVAGLHRRNRKSSRKENMKKKNGRNNSEPWRLESSSDRSKGTRKKTHNDETKFVVLDL
ncbi:hypothetical protein R1sor_020844 [Riccia sorocarpa]|uniref:Retrotransposon gag domain-containing protein n=1 Tax=Riccia sorocarpa TaxID=122646 RepID=A0ABD3GG33_9MARC